MTWLQYAALTWKPAFSIGNDIGFKYDSTKYDIFIFTRAKNLKKCFSLKDSIQLLLNIYSRIKGFSGDPLVSLDHQLKE